MSIDEEVIIHYANHISDYCKRRDCKICPFFVTNPDNIEGQRMCQFEKRPDYWREELKRTHE